MVPMQAFMKRIVFLVAVTLCSMNMMSAMYEYDDSEMYEDVDVKETRRYYDVDFEMIGYRKYSVAKAKRADRYPHVSDWPTPAPIKVCWNYDTARERIPFTFVLTNGDEFYASLKTVTARLKTEGLDDDKIVTTVAQAICDNKIEVSNISCGRFYGRTQINFSLITPLHRAAVDGNVLVVRILLRVGGKNIDIEVEDHEGYTPLYHAMVNGSVGVAELLIDAGARVTDQYAGVAFYNDYGAVVYNYLKDFTLLHLVAHSGNITLLEMLRKKCDKQVHELAQRKDMLGKRPIEMTNRTAPWLTSEDQQRLWRVREILRQYETEGPQLPELVQRKKG